MRVLVWHVHGSWTTSFVHGEHTYLIPRTLERDADGRGRAQTYTWPERAVEITPDELRETDVDVAVLQRPHEIELAEKWLGRRPGIDIPAVYVEHDTPRAEAAGTRHPVAERRDLPIVHVTHFNHAFWDSGFAPTTVIEHGVVDPGHRYTGVQDRAGVVINEPVRRRRITGADLLPEFARAATLDVFGMGVESLPAYLGLDRSRLAVHENLPQHEMHAELAERRVYVHPYRWTSLGLSLVEAMHLGMPVVCFAATEAVEAVPADSGVVSTRSDVLVSAVQELRADPERGREMGRCAREAALRKYSLEKFLAAWDEMLREVIG